MNELKPELNSLSKERVFIEFRKALDTEKPSIFFEVLKRADILDIHFKEIKDLVTGWLVKDGSIEFKDVGFSYVKDTQKLCLKNINLKRNKKLYHYFRLKRNKQNKIRKRFYNRCR